MLTQLLLMHRKGLLMIGMGLKKIENQGSELKGNISKVIINNKNLKIFLEHSLGECHRADIKTIITNSIKWNNLVLLSTWVANGQIINKMVAILICSFLSSYSLSFTFCLLFWVVKKILLTQQHRQVRTELA